MIAPENFDHDTLPEASCNTELDYVGRNLQPGALPCDAYHPFYHYQSSAQYTWLARTCLAMGAKQEAETAIAKALFQDHFNAEALAMKATEKAGEPYNKHPSHDAEFCHRTGQVPDAATPLHDGAVTLLQQGEPAKAIMLLRGAVEVSPQHSNSHFLLGRCAFTQGDFAAARGHVTEAIRLSHLAHDAYHLRASQEHLARGRAFAALGERDLAINAFTKALDLHRGNAEAMQERAKLQAAQA